MKINASAPQWAERLRHKAQGEQYARRAWRSEHASTTSAQRAGRRGDSSLALGVRGRDGAAPSVEAG
eukprot:1968558-Pleurochrysis_carterae.AAC.2